jgi:hypothetical protein
MTDVPLQFPMDISVNNYVSITIVYMQTFTGERREFENFSKSFMKLITKFEVIYIIIIGKFYYYFVIHCFLVS